MLCRYASELERRREHDLCLVCGSEKHATDKVISTTSALQTEAKKRFAKVLKTRDALRSATIRFNEAVEQHRSSENNLENVRQSVDEAQKQVRRLRAKLPTSDQAAMAREETRIEGLRREVQNFRRDRELAEGNIESLLLVLKKATEKHREELERNFQRRVRQDHRLRPVVNIPRRLK